MSLRKLLAVFLLSSVGCGSSTEPGGGAGGTGGGAGGTSPKNSYAAIAGLARAIYDAVDAGEDVTPHVEGVFEALDVRVLADDDVTGAQARIEAGLPLVTSRLALRMAQAYAEPALVDVEGFVAGLVEQGVGLAFPYDQGGTTLEPAILGGMMYAFASSGVSQPDVPMEPGYVLPALVHALGQERARRTAVEGAFVDPVWGDGRLDPLQFALLSFTILSKPGTGASRSGAGLRAATFSNPAADFIKDQIKDQIEDQVTGAIQDVVEVPLDKKDAAKVSVCGSLILYGHKVAMKNDPVLLWHAPRTPNVTQVELTLTFEDDYYDSWSRAVLGSAVTDLTGCKFPRKGPVEGKAIEWDVSEALRPHGSYDLMQSTTDDLGRALASWRTVQDPVPQACQVFENQRDAVGATEAIISGVLPGWSTVERIVTFLNPETGNQGDASLTVLYYEVQTGDPCHSQ